MTHVAIHKHKLQAPVMYSLAIIVHHWLTAFFQQVVFVVTINFDLCSVSGTVISGYQVNNTYNLIGKGNPQWPQAFYPVENKVVIQRDDYLVREISDPMSQPKSWQIFNTDIKCDLHLVFCRLGDVHITPQVETEQPI